MVCQPRLYFHSLSHEKWLIKCDSSPDLLPGKGPSVGLFEDYALRFKYFPRKLAWPIGGFSQTRWKLSAVFGFKGPLLTSAAEVTTGGFGLAWHHVCEPFLFWWGVVGVVLRVCDVRPVACIDSVDAIKNKSQALLQFTGRIPHVM